MFSIKLLPGPLPEHLEGEICVVGRIEIGDFSESFVAPTYYWKPVDYARHWLQALERIVRSGRDSSLITGMEDPLTGSHAVWWPLYLDGESVHVHNCLFFFKSEDGARRSFDPRDPYSLVTERTLLSDDGEKVSEWTIPLSDLEKFLASRPKDWTGY